MSDEVVNDLFNKCPCCKNIREKSSFIDKNKILTNCKHCRELININAANKRIFIKKFNNSNKDFNICKECYKTCPINDFINKDNKIVVTCKICRDKISKRNKQKNEDIKRTKIIKKCQVCKIYKNMINFITDDNIVGRICLDCKRIKEEKLKEEKLKNKEEKLKNKKNKVIKSDIRTCIHCNFVGDKSFFHKKYNSCKKCISKYNKEYKIKRREKYALICNIDLNELSINKKEKRKEKRKEIKRKRQKERIKNDPIYRLRKNVTRLIIYYIKKNNGSKNGKSSLKYLPFTVSQLKEHIESLFEPWMNWDNQGKYNINTWDDNDPSTWTWQLDHIIPQSKLPYSSMEDENFKKCWDLSNLRPYSAKQNILDGNRR